MLPEIFEFIQAFFCVIFCAASVKITDDFLDSCCDQHVGKKNLANAIGPGAMVYALLLMGLAAALNAALAVSLFLASYIVGMFNQLTQRMPTRLTGYQEAVIIFIGGLVLFGWRLAIFSILFILAVQLVDDCVDARLDGLIGRNNFAHRFGIIECCLLALLLLLTAWMIVGNLFLPVFFGTTIVYFVILFCEGALRND